MVFCTRCGKQIEEGQVCECSTSTKPIITIDKAAAKGFFDKAKNEIGLNEPEGGDAGTYERGCQIVSDNIKSSEGEISVKQYKIAVLRTLLKFERAEGRMQVTNKRVIFRATGRSIGGRTTLQHEYAIDEIAGIEARSDYKFNLLYFLIGVITLGLAPIIMARVKIWLKLAAVGAGILLRVLMEEADEGIVLFLMAIIALALIVFLFFCFLNFCLRPNLTLRVKNKTGMGTSGPVDVSIGGTFFMEVIPTEETDLAIREMGAMINDIQKLGDLGLQKWVNK